MKLGNNFTCTNKIPVDPFLNSYFTCHYLIIHVNLTITITCSQRQKTKRFIKHDWKMPKLWCERDISQVAYFCWRSLNKWRSNFLTGCQVAAKIMTDSCVASNLVITTRHIYDSPLLKSQFVCTRITQCYSTDELKIFIPLFKAS